MIHLSLDRSGFRKIAFDYEIENVFTQKILVITDHSENGNFISVTNAVDYVLAFIKQRESILPDMIIYRDSDKVWDRIKTKNNGMFDVFTPIIIGMYGKELTKKDAIDSAYSAIMGVRRLQ